MIYPSPIYIDTLASYLPALLRKQLAENPVPLNAPRTESFQAAFLFGDISGFTPLTARLTQKGEEGVEELSRLLNGYFDRLINIITTHGGDIIKFAGDAALVVWPVRDGMEMAVRRAAQCALVIQAELHNYETFEGARLTMRIGLGCGEMSLSQLGGVFGRWEAFVTGQPIRQASIAQERCQPGQIILSPVFWAASPDGLRVELVEKDGKQALRLLEVLQPPEPHPTQILPLPPIAENAARAFVPGAILQRLASGQTSFLAELRRLTVIFVNLPDFEHLDNLPAAQTLTETLQRALYHYEGSVNQLLMDDKGGTTLVAALGIPPFSHENDPVRGLLAAREIQAGLKARGLRHAIGVTTGHVYCGERGNDQRREYALIGEVVITAARLMVAVLKAGGDDIYCDETTWQAAQSHFAFEILTPIMVKGRTERVAIYRPLHEKSTILRSQTELIGRETEKDFISDALQSLLRGEIQGPLVIEGEAGMGKSRLVEEVKRQAEATGLAFYSGTGDAIERTTAYHAWRSVVRQGFGLSSTESLEEQRTRVESALPEQWKRYAPLLDAILPLNFRETGATSVLRPQARLDKTREMFEALLWILCSRAPAVLVMEDAHWFDTASWNALTTATRLGRQLPLLVILTTRPLPEPYPPEYVRLLEEPGCRPLRLAPLEPTETAALISQQLQIIHIGVHLREFIQQRAEGNPFFVEEIILALRQSGALIETPDSCDLKPGGAWQSIALPNTVQGLISNRIDRLKPAEQMALKVASVLGRVFNAEMMRAVYPMEAGRAEIDRSLRVLQENGFIASVGAIDFIRLPGFALVPEHELPAPPKAGSYEFKHAITREAIYNQMLFAQRRQLHRAVAKWVEETYADDLEPHYALLAHHWRHTIGNPKDDPDLVAKVLDYIEKAGEQAEARLNYQETAEFFTRALNMADKLPAELMYLVPKLRRMRWLDTLGHAQYNQGRIGEARHAMETVIQLGGRPMPETNREFYVDILREAIIQTWHRLRPHFLIPYRSKEREALEFLVSDTQAWLYAIYYFDNQPMNAGLAMIRAVNIAENLHNPPEILKTSYSGLGLMTSILGLDQLYDRLAQQFPITSGKPTAQSGFDTILSARFVGQGKWEQAQACCERSLTMLEQQSPNAYRERGLLTTMLCFVYYYQGWYEKHLEGAEIVGQMGRMSNDVEFYAWHMTGWAMDHSLMGNFKALEDDLAKMEHLLPDIPGSGMTQMFLPTYRGRLAVARQDWKLAEACVAQLEERSAASLIEFYSALDSRALCAEVPLAQWQHAGVSTNPQEIQRWQASAKRAIRALWWFSRFYPIGKPAAHRYKGYYEWLSGKPEKARRNWQSSLAAAQKLSMPHEEALAHWALAQLPDPEQFAHRQSAREILEKLGASAYFEHLERGKESERWATKEQSQPAPENPSVVETTINHLN